MQANTVHSNKKNHVCLNDYLTGEYILVTYEKERMMDSNKVYYVFDQGTIDEFKSLIIAISEELQTVQTWYTVAEAAE